MLQISSSRRGLSAMLCGAHPWTAPRVIQATVFAQFRSSPSALCFLCLNVFALLLPVCLTTVRLGVSAATLLYSGREALMTYHLVVIDIDDTSTPDVLPTHDWLSLLMDSSMCLVN